MSDDKKNMKTVRLEAVQFADAVDTKKTMEKIAGGYLPVEKVIDRMGLATKAFGGLEPAEAAALAAMMASHVSLSIGKWHVEQMCNELEKKGDFSGSAAKVMDMAEEEVAKVAQSIVMGGLEHARVSWQASKDAAKKVPVGLDPVKVASQADQMLGQVFKRKKN